MPLDGTLQNLSLPNLIQLQCSEQRRAQIRLERNGIHATLFIENGELIHAQLGACVGDDAVYELLLWSDGAFHVSDDVATAPAPNVETGWQTLMLEGLRRSDEAKADNAELFQAATREMQTIAGARDWVLGTVDGLQITANGDSAPDERAARGARAAQRAARIGALLDCGAPGEIILASGKQFSVSVPRGRAWLSARFTARAAWLAARATLCKRAEGEM